MDRELICSVLRISPDHWPPDHYKLIGLRPTEATAAAIETRVHDLSTRLRPYQLAHPDAVTDALNRLAQALVCLTDPAARAAYDASLQLDEAPLVALPPDPIVRAAPSPRSSQPTEDPDKSTTHRLAYRRLAAARRLRSAWREAGAVLDQSTWRLDDRAEAIEFVRLLWQIRDCATADGAPAIAGSARPGALVVSVSERTRILHDLRRMTPHERAELAADWRGGLNLIEREVRSLHNAVQRPRLVPQPIKRAARYMMTHGLDVTLLVLGLTAIAIALLRSRN